MGQCDVCGKGPQFGHNVSHSKRRTNRQWAPNIQKVQVEVDGVLQHLSMCTRCMRTLHKSEK
jgi:large subunit ribosomal protein L28